MAEEEPAIPPATIRSYARDKVVGEMVNTKYGPRWKSLDKVAYVEGLAVQEDPLDAAAKLFSLGQAAEDPYQNCLLQSAKVTMKTADLAEVALHWEYDESTEKDEQGGQSITIETGARIVEVETDLDNDGDPITVTYNFGADFPVADLPDPSQGLVQTQRGLIRRGEPACFMILTRIEEADPSLVAGQYTGDTNEKEWRGGAPRTWRCEGITGTLLKNGYYNVRYEFAKNPKTWDTTVYFRDKNGNVPSDVDVESGDGVTVVEARTSDFADAFGF